MFVLTLTILAVCIARARSSANLLYVFELFEASVLEITNAQSTNDSIFDLVDKNTGVELTKKHIEWVDDKLKLSENCRRLRTWKQHTLHNYFHLLINETDLVVLQFSSAIGGPRLQGSQ